MAKGLATKALAKEQERLITSVVGRYSKPIPKDTAIELIFSIGAIANTENFIEVMPDRGFAFSIRYFALTTPVEVSGNIIVSPFARPVVDPVMGTKLLAIDQAANIANVVIDAGDFDQWSILCDRFWVYGRALVATTANRIVRVTMGGKEVEI